MASTFTPLHDRILVRRLEEGETLRGGIIIPDSAKEKPQQGTVISVGKGKSNDEGKVFPLDVKAGDTVLFGKYSGTEIKLDGEGPPHHARGRSLGHPQIAGAGGGWPHVSHLRHARRRSCHPEACPEFIEGRSEGTQ